MLAATEASPRPSPARDGDEEERFFDALDGFDPASRAEGVRLAAARAGREGQPYFSLFVEARRAEVVGGFVFRGEALEGVVAQGASQLFAALGALAERTARRCAASAPEVAQSLARGTMAAAWAATRGAAGAAWSFWTYPIRLPMQLLFPARETERPRLTDGA